MGIEVRIPVIACKGDRCCLAHKPTIGAIVKPTARVLKDPKSDAPRSLEPADGDEEEPEEPIKVLEEVATFDNLIAWGHEALPEVDDPFVKGVDEWIRFAEAVHCGSLCIGRRSTDKAERYIRRRLLSARVPRERTPKIHRV